MGFSMKSWLVGSLAALLLSGCASDLAWSLRFASEKPVDVRELARSQECGTQQEQSAVSMFVDTAEVRHWQESRGITLLDTDAMPAGPYALVEMGRHDTAGYGLAVSRKASIRKDLLVLKGTFVAPAADAVTAQVVTSPCVLMSLPPGFYRGVIVLNQASDVQASSLSRE
jgi:hypothetical protein